MASGSLTIFAASGYLPHQGTWFIGNQPVDNSSPQSVVVNAVEGGTNNWPQTPDVTVPTSTATSVNPTFVGNQPVNFYPPQEVQINDIEAPTQNWPQAPNYPVYPPPIQYPAPP